MIEQIRIVLRTTNACITLKHQTTCFILAFCTLFVTQVSFAQYTKLLDLDGAANGRGPFGSLFSDGTFLYGMTREGGTNDKGTIFKIKPDGNGYVKLLDFAGTANGSLPLESLISDGTFLYGMTQQGGANNFGTIFKIMPDGGGYVKLLDFAGASNGQFPHGSLISDGTFLYGMTTRGGTNNAGTIFKIMTDGTGYVKLQDFVNTATGRDPRGSLISDGTFLYGMTTFGGTNDFGTIFKIMPDGTGYAKLLDFAGTANGRDPEGSLISDGTFLYGMTQLGGTNNFGTIFKIRPDGTGYTKLLDFAGSTNGSTPRGSLISDGTFLYGMTAFGGTNSKGIIFKIMPDGTGFTKLLDFTGVANGDQPEGSLISYGTSLYGMTRFGGPTSNGTIFKYSIAPPVPTITNFTPANGPIGTTVTITGTNFSTTVANNIVYFGATKATVAAASNTHLTVTVPTGATYKPISVMTGGLTASSANPFLVTFNCGGTIDVNSFSSNVDFASDATDWIPAIVIHDMDGDGKPDVVVTNNATNSFSVFKNTATAGIIAATSFATHVDYTTGTAPRGLAVGDLDGDGKPDVVVTNHQAHTISVFRNTSSTGTIDGTSFAPKIDFATAFFPSHVEIADLDLDGKLDLVAVNIGGNSISIFRNTSAVGSITSSSFAAKVDLASGTNPYVADIGDLDNDGKPDIVVSNSNSNSISIFKNISSPGAITAGSFAAKVNIATADPDDVQIGDLDLDGKQEIAVANWGTNKISVFRNVSSTGTINASSFSAAVQFTTNQTPEAINIADINGDGKPDLTVSTQSDLISVLKNTSSPGAITSGSFSTKVDFTGFNTPDYSAVGDLDGDGKPEIIVSNYTDNTIAIYHNTISTPAPTISTFTPTTGPVATSITITGTNFDLIPSNNIVKFNGIAAVVTASTATSISTSVPSGATSGTVSVQVGCNMATSATNFTVTTPTGIITINMQPFTTGVCNGATATFAIAASGTTNITYQWQKFNTTLASFQNVTDDANYSGATSNTLTVTAATSSLAGDYRCTVSGDFASSTFSNTATLTVLAPAAPTTTPMVSDGCGVQTYNLTASSAIAGEFRWYDVASGGVPQETNTTGNFTTPALSASATYYATFFDGVCESSRTPSMITIALNGPGVLDNFFVPQPSPDGFITFIEDMFVQPDNKIVVNTFTIGSDEYFMTRLLPDGALDPGFQTWSQTLFDGFVDVIELQADGKILFAGRFSEINGANYGRIARLNSDGTLDGSFNSTSPGFDDRARAIAIQPDGKIIVGGSFTSYNGSAVNRIVRINPNGTIDGSFTVGSGTDGSVDVVVIQPDGKILISGGFSVYNSLPANKMARLNSDGSLDNSFNGVGIRADVIALQADQKILIGGDFTTVGGVSRNGLARLNTDGSLDLTFDPGTGFDDWVLSIYVEPSSKILVGGWFQNVNGEARNFIARLYPDGSIDNFFNPGVGPYSAVFSILPYGTNKIIAGGYIDRWNGELHNGLGVVNNECIRTPLGFDNTTCTNSITISACGGSNGQYRWYTDAVTATPISGETNSTLSITNLSATQTYYVTLKDAICESARVPVTATNTTSPSPSVTPSSVCGNGTVTVNASGGTNGQYRWYTVATGGTAISGEVNSSFTTPVITSTTVYYVAINNGTCESGRTAVTATINSLPSAPTTTGSSNCNAGSVTLVAAGATNGQYRWYDVPTGGTALAGEINNSFITPALTATTTYYVSINNGSCESTRTDAVATILSVPSKPSITSSEPINAGVVELCLNAITLSAPSGFTYSWSNGVTSQQNAIVQPGNYSVVIKDASGCSSISSDVVQVVANTSCVNSPPVINTTSVITTIGGFVSIDLSVLISDPDNNLDPASLQVVGNATQRGGKTTLSRFILDIDYSGINFSGADLVTIRICDQLGVCIEKQFAIEVIGDINVFNGISPNGDGKNDTWIIEYIDLFPDTQNNKVTLYNRWGDLVWEASNYDNTSVVFSGINKNGSELSSGSYFYKIEFEGRASITGYLSLKR